ncbi:TauD/TfdA family dioxygenase [Novosphingobium panipatense]
MALETFDLTPRIGSEIRVDKAALLSGEHAQELRTLLTARGVLVLRGLHLDDEELRTVARSLGDLRLGPPSAEPTGRS